MDAENIVEQASNDSSEDFILRSDEDSASEDSLFSSSDDVFLDDPKRNTGLIFGSSEQEDTTFQGFFDHDPKLLNEIFEQASKKIFKPKWKLEKKIFKCNNRILRICGNGKNICLLDTRGVIYVLKKNEICTYEKVDSEVLDLISALKLEKYFVSDVCCVDENLICVSDRVGIVKILDSNWKPKDVFLAKEGFSRVFFIKFDIFEKHNDPEISENERIVCLSSAEYFLICDTNLRIIKKIFLKNVVDVKSYKNKLFICQDDNVHFIRVKFNNNIEIGEPTLYRRPEKKILKSDEYSVKGDLSKKKTFYENLSFVTCLNKINDVLFIGTETGLKFNGKSRKYGSIKEIVKVPFQNTFFEKIEKMIEKNQSDSKILKTQNRVDIHYNNPNEGIIIVSKDKIRINHKNIQICLKAYEGNAIVEKDGIYITDGFYLHFIRD